MDQEYDAVVCGTGLTECIVSGLLSVSGKKVLHLDRNPYYGGESASLNLTNLYKHFYSGVDPPSQFGANRDWNVDLIPKFVMGCGKLVKILIKTKVTHYLEWQVIDGTYVYQNTKGGFFSNKVNVHKVPATATEVMFSSLMGIWEKRRCKNFFEYCAEWKLEDPNTWKGFDPYKSTMKELFSYFSLEQNTIDFIGHAVALYTNDNYLQDPIYKTMEKISLYLLSILNYGKSPFIYPIYGLGGLPEGFSRLSAIHGGTYMLHKEIDGFIYDDQGKVCGVKTADGEVAKCKLVVCDPSYVKNEENKKKAKLMGEIIRCICITSKPIPNTDKATSCQIILPQKQLNRHNDIYISMTSSAHGVAAKGKYVAIISTVVETKDPLTEIQPAFELLGQVDAYFVSKSQMWQSNQNGKQDNVYVSNSYDATSHFESATDDVLRIWKEITGEDFDLTENPEASSDVL